jgi:carbamoylphosphate synthase small subunit
MWHICGCSYQEILTDPSYAGQFVLMTNPHIGNTGVNPGLFLLYLRDSIGLFLTM